MPPLVRGCVRPNARPMVRPNTLYTGGAEFTFADVTGLALDFDAAEGVFVGGARQFTAANSEYFTRASSASLQVGNTDLYIAAWVYMDSLGATTYPIASKGFDPTFSDNATNEYALIVRATTQKPAFYVNDGTGQSRVDWAGSFATGTWYFVEAYYDTTNNLIGIALDGSAWTTAAGPATVQQKTGAFIVGRAGTSDYMNGRIARLGLWIGASAIPSSAERTFLYNSKNGRSYAELGVAGTDGSDLLTSIVGYWNLGESSGNALDNHGSLDLTDNATVTAANGPSSALATDSSGNGLHGTLTGFTAAQQIESWRADAGQLVLDVTSNKNHASPINLNTIDAYSTDRPSVFSSGYSLRLQSTQTEYLSIFDAATLDLGTADFSLSFWIKPESSGQQVIYGHYADANNYVRVELDSNSKPHLIAVIGGVTKIDIQATTAVTVSAWNHIVFACDRDSAAGCKVYLAGANDTSGTPTTSADSVSITGNVRIGASGASTLYFNGRLFDIRLYTSTLLSAANVTTLAGGGDVSGAAGRWNFSEGPGSGYSLLFTSASSNAVSLGISALSPKLNGAACILISGFFRPTAISGAHLILSELVNANRMGLGVEFTATGFLSVTARSVTDDALQTATDTTKALVAGQLTHFAAVLDYANDLLIGYINGKQVFSTAATFANTTYTHGTPTSAGWISGNGSASYVDGRLDSLRIYGLASTPTAGQVMELAEGSDPTGIAAANLEGQWDFDDGPFSEPSDGDVILGWQDQQSGRLLMQSTAAKRPTYTLQDADFNSKPSILADGTDDGLVVSDASLFGTKGTIFIVFKQATNGDSEDFLSSSDEALATKFFAVGQQTTEYGVTQNSAGTADTVDGNTAADTNAHILTVTSSGTAYTIRLDGVAETVSADSGSNSGDWFGDTADRDNFALFFRKVSSEANHANVKIARILVYDDVTLTASEISIIENELASQYGITI